MATGNGRAALQGDVMTATVGQLLVRMDANTKELKKNLKEGLKRINALQRRVKKGARQRRRKGA